MSSKSSLCNEIIRQVQEAAVAEKHLQKAEKKAEKSPND